MDNMQAIFYKDRYVQTWYWLGFSSLHRKKDGWNGRMGGLYSLGWNCQERTVQCQLGGMTPSQTLLARHHHNTERGTHGKIILLTFVEIDVKNVKNAPTFAACTGHIGNKAL